MLPVKRCSSCGEVKATEAFQADRSRADGLMIRCRECEGRRNRAYYAANRDARLEAQRQQDRKRRRQRMCMQCGQPAISQRHHYCAPCQEAALKRRRGVRDARESQRPSAAHRGYGYKHQLLRKQWQQVFDRGDVIPCARCRMLIFPGQSWDLGHDDFDRSVYTGPEHRACNRATATHRRRRQSVVR
jgi:hypothetical protein